MRRPTGYNGSVTAQEDGQKHPGEARLPAAVAVIVAIGLYGLLPEPLLVGPRLVVPVLELALFIPLVAANPRRMTRQNRLLRRTSIALVLLIAAANGSSLVLLVRALVSGRTHEGNLLLLAAAQVWLTNVLVFALAYWELDRGGPVARTQTARPGLAAADFRFPQDEDHDAVAEVAVRSAAQVGVGAGVHRLPLRLGHELLGVQPDRHHAPLPPGQDAHGRGVRLRAPAVHPRDLPGHQPAPVTGRTGGTRTSSRRR